MKYSKTFPFLIIKFIFYIKATLKLAVDSPKQLRFAKTRAWMSQEDKLCFQSTDSGKLNLSELNDLRFKIIKLNIKDRLMLY